MIRRASIRNHAFAAVAVSASGGIRFDGSRYISDCATVSDLLGPFYRPNSPVRSDLTACGLPGALVELSGAVRHQDGSAPCRGAKVELWHCDSAGQYDQASKDYCCRGTIYTDAEGRYAFRSILPMPDEVFDGYARPACFYLMITAPDCQPLITQLYFSKDAFIPRDVYAASPAAKKRILPVEVSPRGAIQVRYDASLAKAPAMLAMSVLSSRLEGWEALRAG